MYNKCKTLVRLTVIVILFLGFSVGNSHAADLSSFYAIGDTTSCPHVIAAFNCTPDFTINSSDGTCKTMAQMTTQLNSCAATVVNGKAQKLRCDFNCCWGGDPKAATCASLNKEWSDCNNPSATCGNCKTGYAQIGGLCIASAYTNGTNIYTSTGSVVPTGAASLWTKLADPSADIYYTAGNVGIGTATPGQTLTVAGGLNAGNLRLEMTSGGYPDLGDPGPEIKAIDFYYSGGAANKRSFARIAAINYNDSGTGWYDYPDRYDAGLSFYISQNGSLVEALTINQYGDVGIGTSDPGEKLEVYGNIKLNSDDDEGSIFGVDQIKGYNDLRLYGDTSGGPDLVIEDNGDLDISQSVFIQDNLYINTDNSNSDAVIYFRDYGSGDYETFYWDKYSYPDVGSGDNGFRVSDDLYVDLSLGVDNSIYVNMSNESYGGIHFRSDSSATINYWPNVNEYKFWKNSDNDTYGKIRVAGCYGCDIAEHASVNENEPLESGDVVVIDVNSDKQLTKSTEPFSEYVAGIYSSTPGVYMGRPDEGGMLLGEGDFTKKGLLEHYGTIPLALAGQVPVKVTDENGPIQKGDLLTTSSVPGFAMKWSLLDISEAKDFGQLKEIMAENEQRRNAILGKAFESLESGTGKIKALVTLQ
jgi:hypothetical protein